MLRGGISLLALIAAWGLGPAFATTLEEAVERAISTSPDVGAAAGDRRAADEQIRQARSNYLPQADIRTGIGREYANTPSTRAASRPPEDDSARMNRTEATLTVRQMLFDGFQTPSDVERRKQLSESAASRVMQTSETTGLDAIEAFVDVVRFSDIVAINRENVRTHQSYVAALRRRIEVGAGDVGDLRRAQSRLASAQGLLADAEGQLDTARSRYNRVVGEMPVNLQRPIAPESALPPDVESGVELALRMNPLVQRAEADAEAARAQVRQVKAGYYPQFDIEMNGFTGDNLRGVAGRDSFANALLVMRYNLSRGGGDYFRVQEAIERLAAANQRLGVARRDAERDMRLAWNALATARARARAANEQVQSDARGRDAFRRQFDIGRSRILDLLDSERDYYNSLNLRTGQEATALFGVYRVLQSAGVLLRTLKIKPPEEALREDMPWTADVAVTTPAKPEEPMAPTLPPGLRLQQPPELAPETAPPLTPEAPAIVPSQPPRPGQAPTGQSPARPAPESPARVQPGRAPLAPLPPSATASAMPATLSG
ncbi:MAG: TolC family outer membrane protein, partial [Alphaproteobacteria bacterium]|nr:TolC family outer membrane protein [Alphaproteobacteria bacterium]